VTGRYDIRAAGATEDEVAALVVVLQALDMADDKLKAADDPPPPGRPGAHFPARPPQHARARAARRTYIRF